MFPGFLLGQFHNLATTDDGSLLIFSSALPMQGTTQFSWDKLFSIDSAGLKLYQQREQEPPAPGSMLSNYYLMRSAELSGDGGVSALITQRVCVIAGSSCFLGPSKLQSEVSGLSGQGVVLLRGQMRISRNGRYAFLCCDGSLAGTASLLDLNTMPVVAVSGSPDLSVRRMVASTGTAVVPTQQQSLLVATLSGAQTLPTSATTIRAVVDDNALNAVYEGKLAEGGKLLARVNLQTGAESALVRASDLSLVGVSNDGQLVAFLSDAKLTSADTGGLTQLFSVRPDAAALRQITQDPAGIVEAVLAGNGAVAFAVTASGRLLKIDTASGAVTQLIGRTLTLDSAFANQPVAGSAICVTGTGLVNSASSAAPPLPTSLAGLQLLLDGSPLPLQDVAPGQACFQLPWNTAVGAHTLAAATDSDIEFQGTPTISLPVAYQAYANFLWLGPQYPVSVSLSPYPIAAHQDFSSLVTRANPARPGEIIHFYMTGLGPVDPPVPDAIAAPSNPPARATAPFACQFSDFHGGGLPASVLFAGLAPGFVGYYQVSLRLPEGIPVRFSEALMVCSAGLADGPHSIYIPMLQSRCPALPAGAPVRNCFEPRYPAGQPQ